MTFKEVKKILKIDSNLKGEGKRIAVLELGLGKDSDKWYTEVINATPCKIFGSDNKNKRADHHTDLVGSTIFQLKPEAEVFLLDSQDNESMKWVRENDIDIVLMSISDTAISLGELKKTSEQVFMCTSAGNSGKSGETMRKTRSKYWFEVGAIDENFNLKSYSSHGYDRVDGVTFAGVQTYYGDFEGTSQANPIYACLLIEFMEVFENRFNEKPTVETILEFIDKHSHNTLILDEDSDLKLGYGMLILPEKYHIKKYELTFPKGSFESLDQILIHDDENGIYFQGISEIAKIIDGRTYVPLRVLTELLGSHIQWNGDERKVEIFKIQGDH